MTSSPNILNKNRIVHQDPETRASHNVCDSYTRKKGIYTFLGILFWIVVCIPPNVVVWIVFSKHQGDPQETQSSSTVWINSNETLGKRYDKDKVSNSSNQPDKVGLNWM